jgi:hypothetical protein
MHSISVISGNITSTGFAQSREIQANSQASSSRGGIALNSQGQDEVNGQAQAAAANIDTVIGGSTPDPSETPYDLQTYHYPSILAKTTKVTAQAGTDNAQGQGLLQNALVKSNWVSGPNCDPIIFPPSGGAPLAKNEGTQNQVSDQTSDSDVNVGTTIGDPKAECPPTPAPVPDPDPVVIVDETLSQSRTENKQDQCAGQAAEVQPQYTSGSGGQQNQDPAINELGQNQEASKATNARNTTRIAVAPGGRHDPYRLGVGPTHIQATRTVADAGSENKQSQAYEQTAVASSGYPHDYADNTAGSKQVHESATNADNGVSIYFRTNTIAPLQVDAQFHAALAGDESEQTQNGSQAAAASGRGNRARNRASDTQSNSQVVGSNMRVRIDV